MLTPAGPPGTGCKGLRQDFLSRFNRFGSSDFSWTFERDAPPPPASCPWIPLDLIPGILSADGA